MQCMLMSPISSGSASLQHHLLERAAKALLVAASSMQEKQHLVAAQDSRGANHELMETSYRGLTCWKHLEVNC